MGLILKKNFTFLSFPLSRIYNFSKSLLSFRFICVRSLCWLVPWKVDNYASFFSLQTFLPSCLVRSSVEFNAWGEIEKTNETLLFLRSKSLLVFPYEDCFVKVVWRVADWLVSRCLVERSWFNALIIEISTFWISWSSNRWNYSNRSPFLIWNTWSFLHKILSSEL